MAVEHGASVLKVAFRLTKSSSPISKMSLPNLAASASSSSSIDSILLKRDRLLGTKTNVHLEKLQTSRDKRAESTEKSRNLLDKISFKSRNIAKVLLLEHRIQPLRVTFLMVLVVSENQADVSLSLDPEASDHT